MLSYEPGMLVRSLAGHDIGKLDIIIEERDQMLLLLDGKIRTVERPQTKQVNHSRYPTQISEYGTRSYTTRLQ